MSQVLTREGLTSLLYTLYGMHPLRHAWLQGLGGALMPDLPCSYTGKAMLLLRPANWRTTVLYLDSFTPTTCTSNSNALTAAPCLPSQHIRIYTSTVQYLGLLYFAYETFDDTYKTIKL